MAPSNVRASTSESSSGASSWPKSEVSPRASSGFTVRRPVGEVDDTGAERLGVHKLQLLPITSLLEEAPPAAHDNRMDHETELVEEVPLQQRPDEGAAARDPDVLARLPLELVDLLRDVPADERRVVPPERFHPSGSFRVVETTYLRTPFMWTAAGFSSGSCCG